MCQHMQTTLTGMLIALQMRLLLFNDLYRELGVPKRGIGRACFVRCESENPYF